MAASSALQISRIVSAFKFPLSLSTRHEEGLRKQAIGKEFALASEVRIAADNEPCDLNFQALLPHEERSKSLQRICFLYVDLGLKAEALWRIKPDTAFALLDGSHLIYLSCVGDKVRAYFLMRPYLIFLQNATCTAGLRVLILHVQVLYKIFVFLLVPFP
jgi:hypothetical protein